VITQFKIFEDVHTINPDLDVSVLSYLDGVPKVGNYVICEYIPWGEILGRIIEIDGNFFTINILDMPEDLRNKWILARPYGPSDDFIKSIRYKQIKYWSKSKEDLEHIMSANKYNL
jgi:hypothetical protein